MKRTSPGTSTKSVYLLELADLGSDRLSLNGSFRPGEVDFSGDGLMQLDLMDWSCFVERAGLEVRLRGSLTTKLELACVRCLEPIQESVRREFDLLFQQRDSLVYDENAEIALEQVDTGTAFMTGTELSLSEIIHEQVLLELPMKPLCKTDCQGLCAVCGANLNENSCDCPSQTMDPAFASLLEFKKRLEGRFS